MTSKSNLNRFEDLYYKAQFRQVLDQMSTTPGDENLSANFHLLRASVLFEVNEAVAAKNALEAAVAAEADSDREEHMYALARMAYMNDQFREARTLFGRIFEDADDQRLRFKALLGIANSYANEDNWDNVGYLIDDLISFPLERDDDKICMLHFNGVFLANAQKNFGKAREAYQEAMRIAATHNWNYWIIRSLYGLAKIAKQEKRASELTWTLNILSAFVDGTQAMYLSHMINQEFEGLFKIEVPVEFDASNMRMMIKDQWISFNDKPKLYKFLELLHMRGQFVKKKSIAESLWPEEAYVPGVHDPRIFDIAKRVRAIMNSHDCEPVTLLSGRQGYKLAVCA